MRRLIAQGIAHLELSHCLYLSRHTGTIGQTGLRQLLQQARENNVRAHITGALLFDGERFVQWVEGPPDAIDRLAGLLSVDDRHHGFRLLSDGPLAARRHRRWLSGYVEIERVDHFERSVAADANPAAVLEAFEELFGSADVE